MSYQDDLFDSAPLGNYGLDDLSDKENPVDEKVSKDDDDILGVDKPEVVKPRRKPVPLDEQKLLGPKGLPYLKDKIGPRFRFKGKGHERRDLTKIITAYQVWAHDLYSKANFQDFIELAKRAGSKPQIRVYRRSVIMDEQMGVEEVEPEEPMGEQTAPASNNKSLFLDDPEDETTRYDDLNDWVHPASDDDLYVTPRVSKRIVDDDEQDVPGEQGELGEERGNDLDDGIPDEDELEALQMAELGF